MEKKLLWWLLLLVFLSSSLFLLSQSRLDSRLICVVFWSVSCTTYSAAITTRKGVWNNGNGSTTVDQISWNVFLMTISWWGDSNGDRWITLLKGSNVCLMFSLMSGYISYKHLSDRWFETPWRSCDSILMVWMKKPHWCIMSCQNRGHIWRSISKDHILYIFLDHNIFLSMREVVCQWRIPY